MFRLFLIGFLALGLASCGGSRFSVTNPDFQNTKSFSVVASTVTKNVENSSPSSRGGLGAGLTSLASMAGSGKKDDDKKGGGFNQINYGQISGAVAKSISDQWSKTTGWSAKPLSSNSGFVTKGTTLAKYGSDLGLWESASNFPTIANIHLSGAVFLSGIDRKDYDAQMNELITGIAKSQGVDAVMFVTTRLVYRAGMAIGGTGSASPGVRIFVQLYGKDGKLIAANSSPFFAFSEETIGMLMGGIALGPKTNELLISAIDPAVDTMMMDLEANFFKKK